MVQEVQVVQVVQVKGHGVIQKSKVDVQTSTPSLLRAALTLEGWDSSSRLTITCRVEDW